MNGLRVSGSWERVSVRKPCAVCESDSWCCRDLSRGLVLCMRVKSDKPSRGKAGGWLHGVGAQTLAPIPRQKKEPEERPFIDWDAEAKGMSECKRARVGRDKLATLLGVTAESLELLGVGVGEDRDGRYWSFPERTGQLKVTGIVRRYEDGTKKMIRWGRHGVYLIPYWWRLAGPVLLPEGGSDTAALVSLGLSAIGRPSNIGGVEYLIGLLRDHVRPIVVLGERDEKPDRRGKPKTEHGCPKDCQGCMFCWPGLAGAKATADRLSKSLKRNVLYRLPPTGFKDAREWLKKEGEFSTESGLKFVAKLTMK